MKKSLLLAGMLVLAVAANAQHPFAYGLKRANVESGTVSGESLTVNYTLNADAQNVVVKILKVEDGSVVKGQELTSEGLTKGAHQVEISLDGLEKGVEYTFSVQATGVAGQSKEVFSSSDFATGQAHQFWSPYGIAVDNNTNSEHFGRVLCNESQTSVPASYFAGGKVGIFEYTPQGEFVAYHNPLNIRTDFCPDGTTRAFNFKKTHISKDGRIFVGVDNCVNNPIYELSADLQTWTPLFEGTLDAETGYINDANGALVAGPSAAFAIAGEGDNLKLVNLACKGGQVFNYGNFTTHYYDLGTATSWAAPATNEVMPLSMQYTISAQSVSIAMDEDGKGIWYVQYRGTPTEDQPAVKHVTLTANGWVEDYSDVSTVARGGGVAWNKDYTLLAMPKGNNLLGIYEVSYSPTAVGPVLTQKYSVSTPTIRGFNDIAFDYANNVYACDNGKEVLQQIQLPLEEPVCETPAPVSETFHLPTATAINDVTNATVDSVKKVYENGQIYIIKGERKFNIMGVEVK